MSKIGKVETGMVVEWQRTVEAALNNLEFDPDSEILREWLTIGLPEGWSVEIEHVGGNRYEATYTMPIEIHRISISGVVSV